MEKYHVIDEANARRLGIIDAAGVSQEHEATLEQVAAAAEFASDHYGAALAHARAADADRWVIDESGDSDYVAAEVQS